MSIIDRMIQESVQKGIKKVLDDELENIVICILRNRLTRTPSAELNEVGFRWAWFFCLQKHWPDIDNETAQNWLNDYISYEIGDSFYKWSYNDAKQLAADYVSEFGETR